MRPAFGWIVALAIAGTTPLSAWAQRPVADEEPGTDKAGAGEEAFRRGVASYRGGAFTSALYLFDQAQAQGNRSPNLTYDIGLTLYQLGRDDESQQVFEKLATMPGYESIAQYHIALIALRTGARNDAASRLRYLAQYSEYAPLRELASEALPRVERDPLVSRRAIYGSLGAGYDGNAGFQTDELQDVADTSDRFLELTGLVDWPTFRSLAFTASVYAREYADQDDFSQRSGQLGVRKDFGYGLWQAGAGAQAERSYLGSDVLHDAGTGFAEVRRMAGPGVLALRLAATRFAARDVYPELDGWRERGTLKYVMPGWSAAYELELNQREDLELGTDFASRSPTRQQLAVGLHQPTGYKLMLDWSARYRVSRYPDDDVIGGSPQQRRDELLEGELDARWPLSSRWSVLAELRHSHNGSNLDNYDYRRTTGLLAVEAAW